MMQRKIENITNTMKTPNTISPWRRMQISKQILGSSFPSIHINFFHFSLEILEATDKSFSNSLFFPIIACNGHNLGYTKFLFRDFSFVTEVKDQRRKR
jgi:hypothetical protein